MKTWIYAIGIAIVLKAGAAYAQERLAHNLDQPAQSNAQIKQLKQTASSAADYTQIAAYYAAKQQNYQKKADEEKIEWQHRSSNIVSIAAKYPRPVDSARNLYDYYSAKAAEMGQLESVYMSKADAAKLERK